MSSKMRWNYRRFMSFMVLCMMLLTPLQEVGVFAETDVLEEADVATPHIRIYPYVMDPSDYPDHDLRDFNMPDRATFYNQMQLDFSVDGTKEVVRMMNVPTDEKMQEILEKDNWIYVRGGKYTRIPGVDNNSPNIESQAYVDNINTVLDDRYLGKIIGEVDGGWTRMNARVHFPMANTKEDRYYDFLAFIDPFELGAKGHLSALHNISGHHVTAKTGSVKILGTQNFTRSQSTTPVQFALARGAGKQYGVLWKGQYSGGLPFETGWKMWIDPDKYDALIAQLEATVANLTAIPEEDRTPDQNVKLMQSERKLEVYPVSGPEKGVAISVYRNYLYSMYLYNAAFIGYESGAYYVGDDTKLNPVGEMCRDAKTFIDAHKNPGAMQTPVAFLGDFDDAFWRTPEVRKGHGRQYYTWDDVPYDEGNWVLHNLFDMINPGYRNANWFDSQRYEFPGSPYGDIADFLLSDVNSPLLDRYSLVVAAGKLTTDMDVVKDKLDSYLQGGGNFVVTGDNAKTLWPEWQIGNQVHTIAQGDTLTLKVNGGTETITEDYQGSLLSADNLPSNAKIVASYGNLPAIVEIPEGNGMITLILSPYGLNDNPKAVNDVPLNDYWTEEITYEYGFLEHVKALLDYKLASQSLFQVDNDELRYITCAKGDGEYTLGIINGTPYPQDFSITTQLGTITSIEEYILDDIAVEEELGFVPEGYHDTTGESDEDTIRGGACRLYKIMVDEGEDKVDELSETSIAGRPSKKYLSIDDDPYNMKYTILSMPSYFEYFNGVKLSGQSVLKLDQDAMEKDVKWYNYRAGDILVDARDLDNTDDLDTVVQFLSGFKKGKHLILPTDVTYDSTEAVASGITIQAETDVEVINTSTNASDIDTSKLLVLDMEYDDFNGIYHDIQVVDALDGNWVGGDYTNTPSADTTQGIEAAYLAVRGTKDIQSFIADHSDFYDYFGGVKLEIDYVYKRSADQWEEDMNYLSSHNLNVMVDFSSYMNFFNNIALITQMHNYEEGMAIVDNVLDKMESQGVDQGIFTCHMGDFDRQKVGIKLMLEKARDRNINMHIRNSSERDGKFTSKQIHKLRTRILANEETEEQFDNFFVAMNLITKDVVDARFLSLNRSKKIQKMEYVLVGTPGNDGGTVALPFHEQPNSTLSNFDASICTKKYFKELAVVYDGIYNSWDETLEDVAYFQQLTQ